MNFSSNVVRQRAGRTRERSQLGCNDWSWVILTKIILWEPDSWKGSSPTRLLEFGSTLPAQWGGGFSYAFLGVRWKERASSIPRPPPQQTPRESGMNFSITTEILQRADLI